MKIADDTDLSPLLRGFDLPPCPAILSELQSTLNSDAFDTRRVSQLISRDVALAAAVIRVANSPALGLRRQANSITDALSMLGSRQILNLVVAELLKRAGSNDRGPRLERFWERAALNAATCSRVAERFGGVGRDLAYCYGLFHDAGIPLMLRRFPDYKATLQLANGSEHSFTSVEESRHGVDHAVIGYLLARSWRLSAVLAGAIRSHHDFQVLGVESDSGLAGESCALIALGVISEHIISLFQHAQDESEWRLGQPWVAAFFGMSEAELDDCVEDELYQLRLAAG
ncbi:HDOD domain-containing protein [Rhodocyclus tenuis]|uniref:HDOD domain-containing protein n=1 Tax=Rhodocyclus tenuis TaxID=1066 RepID=UPI001905C198|nr:HDOD domain-containing protein [Rhodocyclus tenuis]MBK1681838.1 hypothetical protein [Rhodocyclus tenuis]